MSKPATPSERHKQLYGQRMTSLLGSSSADRFAKLYASCKLPSAATHIRCLTVCKGSGDGRLRCQLGAYRLAQSSKPSSSSFSPRPEYWAISYTWGDGSQKAAVIIDGLRLWVTANAHAALMDVRSEVEDRVVWIDAICIDQENEAERNLQVGIMRRIYAEAAVAFSLHLDSHLDLLKVQQDIIIWLGEPDVDTALALSFLDEFDRRHHDDQWREQAYRNSRNDASWTAIEHIFDRPYWKRVWVLQECSIKPDATIQIGRQQVPYRYLVNLTILVTKKPLLPVSSAAARLADALPVAVMLPLMSTGSVQPSKFLHLLAMGRHQHCSRAHDRIYGLLGILQHEHQFSVPIQYERSVAQIYLDAARALIRHTQSLDIICYSEPENTSLEVPSWVPDWHTPRRQANVAYVHDILNPRGYSASRDEEARFEFDYGGRVLAVQGYLVDSIGACGEAYHPVRNNVDGDDNDAHGDDEWILDPDPDRLRETMDAWMSKSHIFSPKILSRQNTDQSSTSSPPHHTHTHDQEILINTLQAQSLNDSKTSRADEKGSLNSGRLADIHPRAYNRAFFRTKRLELHGLAPDNARSGDLVCIISRCQVPMILRRCESGEYCRVVGEAFVQSLMYGAYGESAHLGFEEQTFRIK